MGSVNEVIARLEQMPKQGESYDHKGRHGWANPIREDTGPLLEVLTMAARPKRVLEIGTASGLSGCYIARWLDPKSTMFTIEWDEKRAIEAQANFDEAQLPVKVLQGDAMKLIETLDGQFDFVFMDANKDGYFEQFRLLIKLNRLAHPCTIVADNVIDRKTECANFLEEMTHFQHKILATECGLLVATIG